MFLYGLLWAALQTRPHGLQHEQPSTAKALSAIGLQRPLAQSNENAALTLPPQDRSRGRATGRPPAFGRGFLGRAEATGLRRS